MRGIKRLTATLLMGLMLSLCAPQVFAGEILTPPADGTAESPGYTDGTAESPGYKKDGVAESPGAYGWAESPGFMGEIPFPGIYAGIASLVI
jgi:hypothetical protein